MGYASILLAFFLAIGSPIPGKAHTCDKPWTTIPGSNDRCYLFSQDLGETGRTHTQAKQYCEHKGGRLASVGDKPATEADPLLEYFRSKGWIYAWVGATQRIDNQFRWEDDRLLAAESNLWHIREPSGDGVCVEIWQDYYLNDKPCSIPRDFVCESK